MYTISLCKRPMYIYATYCRICQDCANVRKICTKAPCRWSGKKTNRGAERDVICESDKTQCSLSLWKLHVITLPLIKAVIPSNQAKSAVHGSFRVRVRHTSIDIIIEKVVDNKQERAVNDKQL